MLSSGTRLGVYELGAPLGAGGMGEVYRARDTRLGRDVALKVLPAHLADDPSSLARFEQEARHIAALNHPGIVALFDIGTDGHVTFMVTELVEGTSLRGATLPVRKVTEIGAQIADALAAAHSAGVTHRDIKPDNVMLTPEGRVKLLDFGVAKAGGPSAWDGVTVPQTASGSLVGTIGYMAPEQIRAGAIDHRTDIFAVGVLLYELLTGAPPFTGETAPEIMTATLRSDPGELPAQIPDGVQRIVRRCLEKSPDERFQSARDLAFALRQLTASSVTAARKDAIAAPPLRSRAWIAVVAFTLGALATAAVVQRWMAARDAAIDAIQLTRLTADLRDERAPSFSPDGRSLAYLRIGGNLVEVVVRPLDASDAVVVARSNTALSGPVWSADGNQVCYTLRREVWCVAAAGGAPRRILQEATQPRMAPNGRDIYFIRVFEQRPWLYRTSDASGPQRVGDSALPQDVRSLSPVSPDGAAIIAVANSGRWLVSLPGGARRPLPFEERVRTQAIAWLPDSRHVVVAEQTTTLIGSRLVVADTRSAARRLVLNTTDDIEGVTASADSGRVVYAAGPVERDIVEYDSEGKYVSSIAASSMLEGFPAWSPAGDRFVYRAGGPGQSDSLWVGADGGAPPRLVQRLTTNAASVTPISPDGERIVYRDSTGIHVVSVSGGRTVHAFASAEVDRALCWSPDGEWIWFSEGQPPRLGRIPAGGGGAQFVDTKPGILLACSPDARWFLRIGQSDFVLTSADGKSERAIANLGSYATRAPDAAAQFSGDGRRIYLLGLDRRTVDMLDFEGGQKVRSIVFATPPQDQIEGFAFSPDGARVLLTTGGDRSDLWVVEGFARPAAGWKRWFTHWEPIRPAPPGPD